MKKKFLIAILLLSAILILTGCGGQVVYDSDKQSNIVSVSGQSEVEAKPDTAYVSASVSVEKPDAKEAQNIADEIMQKILNDLKGLGIEEKDITTSNYSMDMIRDYSYPEPVLTEGKLPNPVVGYRVSNQIKITVKDIEKVGGVIDAVSREQHVSIHGLQFGLLNNDEAKKEAIQKATSEAKKQAEHVASSLGMKVKGVKKIHVNTNDMNYPYVYTNYERVGIADTVKSVSASDAISPGQLKIHAFVEAEFELE